MVRLLVSIFDLAYSRQRVVPARREYSYKKKQNVVYATKSTDSVTKACGIDLHSEFALVRIDRTYTK
jgi:hypothetical protein